MGLVFCKCGQIKGQCGCQAEHRTTTERGYGADWQRVSKRVREEQPLCEDCLAQGKTTPSTQVHHIVPVSVDWDRRLERSNLVALCDDCHEARHRND